MRHLLVIAISVLFSIRLMAQTTDGILTKSFYYDIDNFSLTAESMIVLKMFTEEIKNRPIEVIEIIGYTEKEGSAVYNQIKSKKRMSSIKGSIDTAMIIHQYTPENLNYPPAFLYSYEDGYNWRRVDIKYKYRGPAITPPIHDANVLKSPEQKELDVLQAKVNKTPEEKIRVAELILKEQNSAYIVEKTPEDKELDSLIAKTEKTATDTVRINQLVEIEQTYKKNSNTVILDKKQSDVLDMKLKPQETGMISTEGKTKDQIDKLVINEKSSSSNNGRKTLHPDVAVRLSKIDVDKMDTNTVILLNLNIQFEGDAPVVNTASISEIDELVKFLKKNNSLDAFIRGHVCCGDNLPLSKKRAKTVYNELVRRGISPTRLRSQGFSNTIPTVDPELTDLDRSKNRRVDVVFYKTGRSNKPDPAQTEETVDVTAVFSTDDNQKIEVDIKGNSNVEVDTKGMTQDQIDNMLVRDISLNNKANSKKENLDMSEKLAKINVETLKSSVVLIILSIEYEGTSPIITEKTTKEINDLYSFLSQNREVSAFIRGHVCCGDNMKLSKKRAKYVYDELIKRGIDAKRLRYQGFSNTLLLVNPERTEADRAKNRRVDVIFSITPPAPK